MPFEYPFYFLRHGETEWNRTGRTQGQLDAPLNETGRAQASRAAEILADESQSSGLSPARFPAFAILPRRSLPDMVSTSHLR